MKHRAAVGKIFAPVLLMACLAGCVSTTHQIPKSQQLLPAQTLTRAELLSKLEERSGAIQTMTASVALDASGGGIDTGKITDYKETTGAIIVERPGRLRVIVKAPVLGTTVADMVSDGLRFRLSIPAEDRFYTGDSNAAGAESNPVKNLRPKHIMDALFVDVMAYVKDPSVLLAVKEAQDGQHSYYVVEFVNTGAQNAHVVEELWFDRTSLEVSKKIVYVADGRVESNIEFLNYRPNLAIPFPETITLQRPIEHYSLKMTFQKTNFNQTLPENAFLLERPSGARETELTGTPTSSQ